MAVSSRLFSKFSLTPSLQLANRVVVAPMCQYSADEGCATDWHLAHWTSLLNSGAATVIIEATGVVPEGRITPRCLGLWDDRTEAALADKLHRARALAPAEKPAVIIQLAHAGRKGSSAVPWEGGQLLSLDQGGWTTVGPSAIPQLVNERPPAALSEADLTSLTKSFVASAKRAQRVGVDGIELHGAHGYLIHSFLSPLSNQRSDQYGGMGFENRIRYPLELFRAMRSEVSCVLGVRLSATDWVDGGWNVDETAELVSRLKAEGCDYVHVSSGGLSPQQKISLGPGYQVPFARLIKDRTGLPTIAVGLITEPQQAEQIVAAGDADLVALARAFLYKPRWGWEAAAALGGTVSASAPYWRCLPREAQSVFGQTRIGQR